MAVGDEDTGTKQGFPPILGDSPRALVLGTLPSRASLEKQQYYGHPRNAFWPIMRVLAGADGSYAERSAALERHGVAVWDVLSRSVRPGSMDADIDLQTAQPNALEALIEARDSLTLVCFNGRKAAELFDRLVGRERIRASVRFATLPSTSPAHAAMSLEEKTEQWAAALAPAVPAIARRLAGTRAVVRGRSSG